MSNESFGLLFIIVIGLLFLVGIGSMITSCWLDKNYKPIKPPVKKHYFKKEEDEPANVILDNKDSFDLDIQDIE